MVDLLPSFDAIPLFPKKKRLCQIQKRKCNEKKKRVPKVPKGTSNNTMIWPLPRPTFVLKSRLLYLLTVAS